MSNDLSRYIVPPGQGEVLELGPTAVNTFG